MREGNARHMAAQHHHSFVGIAAADLWSEDKKTIQHNQLQQLGDLFNDAMIQTFVDTLQPLWDSYLFLSLLFVRFYGDALPIVLISLEVVAKMGGFHAGLIPAYLGPEI